MKIENGTIVLVADGSRKLLLRNDGNAAYPVLRVLPPSAPADRGTPGRQREDGFAAEAARDLADVADELPGDVVVVAPPDTLGRLRLHYAPAVKSRVIAEIGSHPTRHTVDDIARHLAVYLC